jgi:hypothetical protein
LAGRLRDRIAWLAACGLGAIAVSVLVSLAATIAVGRSLPMTIAGTVAAVVIIGVLSRGAASVPRDEDV